MNGKKSLDNEINTFNALIKKIAECNRDALENFYATYGKLIYLTAMTVVKSSFKADEVVNDVLTKIWKTSKSLPKIDNPKGWVYTVTVNCAKDKIKNEKVYEEIFDIAVTDSRIEQIIDDDKFYKDIAVLNETEQQILILKFISDLTFDQIALSMKKPTSYVSTTYYRALEKLKCNNF